MIVVISKDDYGTPVVFVECWGSPQWWCWWVDVSEKPTKRRGRTKKLRREEMLMKENVKFKIGKRGYEKWKVQLRSKELPEHAAQGPVRAIKSKRPAPSLSQDSVSVSARKQPRRWVVWYDNNMILLSNTFQVIVTSPRHGQHQPAASVGHQRQSQDVAEVGGCAALLVQARPRRQESVLVRVQHCGRVPGVPVRDLLLGAKQGHGGPPRRGAEADETDMETAGQILVKKQRSAATPKL